VPGADAAGRDRGRDRVHLVSGKHVHDGRVRAAGRLVELPEYVRGREGKLQRANGLERSVGEAREAESGEDRSAYVGERLQREVSVVGEARGGRAHQRRGFERENPGRPRQAGGGWHRRDEVSHPWKLNCSRGTGRAKK